MKQPKLSCILLFASLLIILIVLVPNPKPLKQVYYKENQFGSVIVFQNNSVRCMRFSLATSTNQACIDLHDHKKMFSYLKVMMAALLLNEKLPNNILLIGLGGGVLTNALSMALPNAKISVIEINPLVVEAARDYFGFEKNSNIELKIMDGYEFVVNAQDEQYDLILIDAFSADYIPRKFLTVQFTENIKRITKPNGVVAINTFKNSGYTELENSSYDQAFGGHRQITTSGNRIIFVKKGEFPLMQVINSNSKSLKDVFASLGISTDFSTSLLGQE